MFRFCARHSLGAQLVKSPEGMIEPPKSSDCVVGEDGWQSPLLGCFLASHRRHEVLEVLEEAHRVSIFRIVESVSTDVSALLVSQIGLDLLGLCVLSLPKLRESPNGRVVRLDPA